MLPGAQLSAANGYATIIPEIVAHGERHQEGQDLLGGSIASLHDGIVETVGDIRRSIDFVVTRPRIDTNRVGYVGLSMGAIVGTITAAVDPRIKAVGLVVGGADWKLIIPSKINDVARQDREGNYGGTLLARAQSQLEDVDPKNYVGRIAPRPVLMLNGRRDNVIPPAASRVLFNAARNPKQQIWSDEGHFLQPNRVARILQTWFNQNLKTRRADNTSSTRLAVR
jgi:cephalosporin-C deacetylase-like acetyl esterase